MATNESILVQEIILKTIQGEGYWTGALVDFVRLWGCPVRCFWCDQEYSEGGLHLPVKQVLISEVLNQLQSSRIIVSGGEPFVQKNLSILCKELVRANKQVHIETSGIHWQDIHDSIWLTLSPKEHLFKKKYSVCPEIWERANEIKFIIESGSELEYYRPALIFLLSEKPNLPIFLQPEWNNLQKTLPITLGLLEKVLDFCPTARLSTQTHKALSLP